MDLALLRTFVAVHRAGSFTRAAALLGLSQPAVTSQIRTLERQLGRPLFLRRARGVTPTAVGDELAHRAAPHLDALLEIAGTDAGAPPRTLHLAGPPEFVSLRVLPALTGGALGAEGAVRAALLADPEEVLEGLAAGHYDLAVTTARPRGGLFVSGALCDEEHVLVAAPQWAAYVDPVALRDKGPAALDGVPLVEVHESLPLVSRYWTAVFDTRPPAAATVVVPDLRAVLECVAAGGGLAVLPKYLCAAALAERRVVALLEPPVPPLRTYFLTARTGTLGLPHLARAQQRLLEAAAGW